MTIAEARAIARQWVSASATSLPGYHGAFTHGSTNWLSPDDELPAGSDLDVLLVLDEPPPQKLGKVVVEGLLLDISYLPASELASAADVLGISHLAGSFALATILDDPGGELLALQARVAVAYPQRPWVERRIEFVHRKILRHLDGLDASLPLEQQVVRWLFATGLTTHLVLVAGLRNPTVRRRYVAARELLNELDLVDAYPPLLELLDPVGLDAATVTAHLNRLATAFDDAAEAIQTPFPFAADLTPEARPIAIDEGYAMVARGDHREAIFWLAATACRCQEVLRNDAPESVRATHEPAFRALLAGLGLATTGERRLRERQLREQLPAVSALAAQATARPD